MLRQRDAVNQEEWNPKGKGLSSDSGIGSKVVKVIRDAQINLSSVESVYEDVLSSVADLSQEEQKAVLLSAASGFTLKSLIKRSGHKSAPASKISERDQKRIDWIRESQGDDEANRFASLLVDAKNATRPNRD